MNRLIKILLGLGIVFVALIVVAVVLGIVLFPAERIKTMIESKASAALDMPVTIGDIGLSFAGLPAVKVSDLIIGPVRQGEVPLFTVKSIKARVNIMKLLSRNIEIVSIEVAAPNLNLITREDGTTNLPELEETEKREDSGPPAMPFPISMDTLTLVDGLITIDNRETGAFITIKDLVYTLSVDIAEDLKKVDARGSLTVGDIAYMAGEQEKTALIEGLGMSFVHELTGDVTTGDFSLTKGDVLIGDMPVSVTAEVKGYTKTEFSVSTGKHEANKLLKLIPKNLFPDKGKLTTSGTYSLTVDGAVDSEPEEPVISFNGTLDVDGVSLLYEGLPHKIDDITCRIAFTEETVSLKEIRTQIGSSRLALSGTVSNYMETPSLSISADGSADLEEVTGAFPMPEGSAYSGTVAFRIAAEGIPSEPEKVKVNGNMKLAGIRATMPETLKHPAEIDGSVTITPSKLAIEGISMKTGVSDMTFKGTMAGYTALAFPKEGFEASFKGMISSKMLDMNDMLVPTAEEEKTASAKPLNLEDVLRSLPVPPNLNIETGISLGQVMFGKMKADSVKGSVSVGHGSVKLNDLNIRAYNGNLSGKAALNISEEDIGYDGSFKLDKLDAGSFISSFFGISEGIFGGLLSSSLSFNGAGLDSTSIQKNLTALGSVSMEKGSITNWDFTKKLGKTISFLDFDTLEFDTILTSFKVADGRVITDDLNAATEFGALNFSGAAGFDTSVNYDIVFKMNKKAVDSAKKNNLGLLSEFFEDESGTPELRIKASGTLKSPSFKIDTSQVKEKAKDKLKAEAEKLLGKEVDKLLGKDADELKKKGKKLLDKIFK